MNDELINKIKRIDKKYIFTFLTVFIFGIVCHGMGIFNKYSYHDDMNFLFSFGTTVTSGRWMLELIFKFEGFLFGDGHFSMPVFNGFISFLFIALSSCIIIKLLDIKNILLSIFVGAIMISFPSITGMMGYMFTFPSYMFALFLSVLGSYLICNREKKYYIFLGIICIGCSVGIYQAFISTMVSLILFYLIKFTRDNKHSFSACIKETVILVLCIICSMAFYFLVNRFFLAIYDAQLTDYQNINSIGNIKISEYLWRILYAYEYFIKPVAGTKYYAYYANIRYFYYLVLLIGLMLVCKNLLKSFKITKLKFLYLSLLYSFVPLATNLIFVMCEPSTVHILMIYGQAMTFIFAAYLLDDESTLNKIKGHFVKISIIILLFVCFMFCRFDNECYLRAEFVQQESISYFTTLVTQIKSVDGYENGMPVCFAFIDNDRNLDSSITDLQELDFINIYPYEGLEIYLNDYAWKLYMERWCGFSPDLVSVDDIEISDEIIDMPSYPNEGSIKVVDGVVIVKF